MDEKSAAYVLINTERDREDQVVEALKKIEGVEAHRVFGIYDACALFIDCSTEKLKERIGKIKIHIPEIRSHLTLHITEGYVKEGLEMKKTPYSII
jgi:hypothetical protein